MDRKIVMGVAAVAGIGLLLYMRKSGDQATIAGSGALVGAGSSASNWAAQPIIINTKAPVVANDAAAVSPAPAPAPAPAPSPAQSVGWSFGGSTTSSGTMGDDGYFNHADGSRSYVADRPDVSWLPF